MSSVANMGDYLPRNKKSTTAAKTGYIKLFRTIRRQSWYKDSDACHLWIEMLLTANHKPQVVDANGHSVAVGRGQLMTSLPSLEKHTGIGRETIRRKLAMFEKDGQIKWQSTNRWRLITILTFDDYQGENPSKTSAKTAQKTDRQNDTLNNTQSDRLKATAGAVVSDIATGNSTDKSTGKTTPNKNGNNNISITNVIDCELSSSPDQPVYEKPKTPNCPHHQILNAWADVMHDQRQPNPSEWTSSRAAYKALGKRWKDGFKIQKRDGSGTLYHDTESGLEWWRDLFAWMRKSDFLINQCRPFCLDWVVTAGNFTKIKEGAYHDNH